jgi:Holliday junction resolvase
VKAGEDIGPLPRLPSVLRVEVKFTTGTTISVPRREREALLRSDRAAVGAVAALFWCGERAVDGRWFIVDAAESFRSSGSEATSLGVHDLRRIEKTQPWLAGVRKHVERTWPAFLAAFGQLALAGHDALQKELSALHGSGRLAEHVVGAGVLEIEHRNAVQAIIDRHGAAVAGHVFQDLLAYLLVLAGYATVRTNPIGVPDIELSDVVGADDRRVRLEISRKQVERLIRLARKAGDTALAESLESQVGQE